MGACRVAHCYRYIINYCYSAGPPVYKGLLNGVVFNYLAMSSNNGNQRHENKVILALSMVFVAILMTEFTVKPGNSAYGMLMGALILGIFLAAYSIRGRWRQDTVGSTANIILTQDMVNREKATRVITVTDYQRLLKFMTLTPVKAKVPVVSDRLMENLEAATLMSQTEIAKSIVTMNSRVKVKDLTSNREAEVTITYPHNTEPTKQHVSVLSEIGLALLGRQEKDIVSWQVPAGVGRFRIERVVYQPEAAGDYFL